jgi:hypothetical protein
MPVVVESRRKKLSSLEKRWPGAAIIDVTSKGPQPWVRFSPFYPHGGIPIPNTPSQTAQSVEGLWQGLKVFEREDIDPGKWAITNMSGIKPKGRLFCSITNRTGTPRICPARYRMPSWSDATWKAAGRTICLHPSCKILLAVAG